jgi:hypothetical protein
MKFGDKLRQILGVAAPSIGAALGGPLGGLAGTFVSKALGVDTDEAALEKLNTDPAALVALKQAELAFKQHLDDNQISLEQIAAADRDSARDRESQVRDNMPGRLAWLLIGGFIAVSAAEIAAIFGFREQVHQIPNEAWLFIGNVSGYLANEAKAAAAYYFGTTRSSSAKDETIAAIAKEPA